MPAVSIIIPVYNTEKYLRRCLDSVCNQTLKDIEIICVDDGSTDGSMSVVAEYASRDPRIIRIDFSENRGAAAARNAGIAAARGEYVGFVDSDDYLDPNFYERLLSESDSGRMDFVKGGDVVLIHEDGSRTLDRWNDRIRKNKVEFWCQFTTAIFRREFLTENRIEFPEDLIVGEDPVFTIKAALAARTYQVVDDVHYYYCRRLGSLNSTFFNHKRVVSYDSYIRKFVEIADAVRLEGPSRSIFFNRLAGDVQSVIAGKIWRIGRDFELLKELLGFVRMHSVRGKARLLFDGTVILQGHLIQAAKRGIYWVAVNLLRKFAADDRFEVTVYLCRGVKMGFLAQELPDLKHLPVVCENFQLGAGGRDRLVKNTRFDPNEYDAYLNVSFEMGLGCPGVANYFVVHDVIPLLRNDWCRGGETCKTMFWSFYSNLPADATFFSVSEYSKKGFMRFFDKITDDRIMVSPIATSSEFKVLRDEERLAECLSRYGVDIPPQSKFIFYLGAANDPRKNLPFMVECFSEFVRGKGIEDLYFVIGGAGKVELMNDLRNHLGSDLDLVKDRIKPVGFVAAEDVNVFLSGALFFAFLSQIEGFGMPPLEAMQAGTPVVCADNSSLPEVVGDAAILVDGNDRDATVNAFDRLYSDGELRKRLIARGLEQSRKFTWEATQGLIADRMVSDLCGKASL